MGGPQASHRQQLGLRSSSSSARCSPRVVPRAAPRDQPQQTAAPSQQAPVEPTRRIPLPGNSLWLLDFLQDKFYDVRGPSFVIQRAESEDNGSTTRRTPRKSGKPARRGAGGGSESSSSKALSLIQRVVHQHPGSIMMLEGAVVDLSEWLELADVDVAQAASSPATVVAANTTCTGIVRVEQQEEQAELQEEDVFYNDSTSPRRTHRVGFTCKCCGARTYSNVNPRVFNEGTLVAQCAKCERWHKLADHFGLFHHLQGPVLGGRPLVALDDVPPSLRLRNDDDEDDAFTW